MQAEVDVFPYLIVSLFLCPSPSLTSEIIIRIAMSTADSTVASHPGHIVSTLAHLCPMHTAHIFIEAALKLCSLHGKSKPTGLF